MASRLAWSVEPSFRKTDAGWTLAFSPNQLADALKGLNGDLWGDRTATTCPVLVVRGAVSRAVDGKMLEEMAAKRSNTKLVTFNAGHVVHLTTPKGFAATVRSFLSDK